MRHDIESCDQGGEDQDNTWLDRPVARVKGERSQWLEGVNSLLKFLQQHLANRLDKYEVKRVLR